MAIETLEDYNAQASCCCPQILCPIPEEVIEANQKTLLPVGWRDPDGDPAIWKSYESVKVDHPPATYTYRVFWTGRYNGTLFDGSVPPYSASTVDVSGDLVGWTGVEVSTYTGGMDFTTWLTAARALLIGSIATMVDADWSFATSAEATFSQPATDPGNLDPGIFVTGKVARVRWRIPNEWNDPVTGLTVTFPGNYYQFTYDIINEPDGWDDPVLSVFRSWHLEDQTTVWTGPGSGDADDPSWLVTEVIIEPPDFIGKRRIVNRRLVCREDWGLGVLPQVWGEAVTLPDPEP